MKWTRLMTIVAMLIAWLFADLEAQNNITFRVKMSIKMRENVFVPSAGDTVVVRGDFQGWGGKTHVLTDPDADSIYTGTFGVGTGTSIKYKFVMITADGDGWESSPDRTLALTGSAQTLPIVYFENDSVFSGVTRAGNMLFTVDMSSYVSLGFFNKAKDTLYTRGGFNGWSTDKPANSLMQPVPGTNFYTINLATKGIVGDPTLYKFFIKYSLDTVAFPTRKGWADWWGWELPASYGGGNRIVPYMGSPNQVLPTQYFNDITSEGVIPAGTNIELTFNIDMRPAFKAAATPFRKTDTLWFETNWENWAASQGWKPGVQSNLRYADADGDSIYTLKFTITGPVPAAIQYQTRYSGGTSEGGGFDYGRFRTRYVRKTGTAWPTSFTFATDVFKQDPPLLVETSPYGITGVKEDGPAALPLSFSLSQNYPNPFNPLTQIEYGLPMASRVTLRVFNLLGQEIVKLVDEEKLAGTHIVAFDASMLPSGVYIYQLSAGQYLETKRMMLLK